MIQLSRRPPREPSPEFNENYRIWEMNKAKRQMNKAKRQMKKQIEQMKRAILLAILLVFIFVMFILN